MKSQNKYRKIQTQLNKIEDLEKKNSRFRRIYSEYEDISNQLNHLDSSNLNDMPDDFIDALIEQTTFLEDEIEEWLKNYSRNNTSQANT